MKGNNVHSGKFAIILTGLALGAAGCGTVVAGSAGNLSAAVSQTKTETARVSMKMSAGNQGMTTSFTATGVFDFAHSRGSLSMKSPVNMQEVFLPPKVYIKVPGSAGTGLPKGKKWVAIGDSALGQGGASGPFGLFGGPDSPADLLASLTAISGGEKTVGTATIRGVAVTEYRVDIDPAKAAARLPGSERASFRQFAKALGSGTIPVDVWVDGKNLVRRVKMTLNPSALGLSSPGPAPSGSGMSPSPAPTEFPSGVPTGMPSGVPTGMPSGVPTGFPSGMPSCFPTSFPTSSPTSLPSSIQSCLKSALPSGAVMSPGPGPSGSGMPVPGSSGGNFRVSESIDFYDFGVPVHVSAPPAAQVATIPGMAASDPSMYPKPPKATGTLTPAQETAAGQAVTAFWTAIGKDAPAAVAKTVLPSQRSCARSNDRGGKVTVKSFRIVSVEPAGMGKAIVRYKVNAKVSGMSGIIPKNTVLWLSAAEHAGQWYVNLSAGSFFGGSCP